MKDSSENIEGKENFLKKILYNKVGLCLFFIAFSVIIDVFGFKLLPILLVLIMNSVFGLKNAVRIWIVYLVLYILISIMGLVLLHKIKNKRSDKKTDFRFVLDLIFIIEFFVVFSYMINLSYLVLDKIKFYVCIDSEFYFFILSISTIIYILNSLIKNIVKMRYKILMIILFLFFLAGTISITNFTMAILFVSLINHFFSVIEYLYGNFYYKLNKEHLDYNSIKIEITKEENEFIRLLFNLGIFVLYIYIVILEKNKLGVLQFLANILNIPIFNVEALPTSAVFYWFGTIIKENKFMIVFNGFAKIIYIGILRIVLLLIIFSMLLFVLAFILFIKSMVNKTSFKLERDKFYKQVESFPINFIKKFIYK